MVPRRQQESAAAAAKKKKKKKNSRSGAKEAHLSVSQLGASREFECCTEQSQIARDGSCLALATQATKSPFHVTSFGQNGAEFSAALYQSARVSHSFRHCSPRLDTQPSASARVTHVAQRPSHQTLSPVPRSHSRRRRRAGAAGLARVRRPGRGRRRAVRPAADAV